MTLKKFSSRTLLLITAITVGMSIGIGSYTFIYAEGLSYFSTDPVACSNCHIMQPQFDSWQKSSHHGVAACVDCHLPKDFVAKYMAKAENGYHHSKGFTFEDFHEPIMIKKGNSQILQENCLSCHQDMVEYMLPGASTDENAIRCIHCHVTVGHGETVGLGGPYKESVDKEIK